MAARFVNGWGTLRALIILAFLSACGESGGGPMAPDLLDPQVDLTPELVLIATPESGPSEFLIGNLRGARFLDDGSVAVLDVHPPHVKLFGASGSVLGAMGGAGQGPGELSNVLALASGPEGTVFVLDVVGRVKRLTRDGEELASGRAPLGFASGMAMVCDRLTFYGVNLGEGAEQREVIASLSHDLTDARTEWTGGAVGHARGGDRVIASMGEESRVRAVMSESPMILSRRCDEPEWSTHPAAGEGGEGATRDGPVGALRLRPGSRGPAGVAPFERGTLTMTVVIGTPVVTEATWSTGAGASTLRLVGALALEDVGADGRLLLSTTRERGEPILLSLPAAALRDAFLAGPGAPPGA